MSNITTNILTPMRNGIRLAADLYRPDETSVSPTIVHHPARETQT